MQSVIFRPVDEVSLDFKATQFGPTFTPSSPSFGIGPIGLIWQRDGTFWVNDYTEGAIWQ